MIKLKWIFIAIVLSGITFCSSAEKFDEQQQTQQKRYSAKVSITLDQKKPYSQVVEFIYPTYEEFYGEEDVVTTVFSLNDEKELVFDEELSSFHDEYLYSKFQDIINEFIAKEINFKSGTASMKFNIFQEDVNRLIFHNAKSHYENKEYQLAIDELNQVTDADKNSIPVLTHRGMAYSGLENYEVSIKFFDKAIAINPDNERLYYSRGYRYKKLKKYDLALEDTMKSYSMEKSYWETYEQLNQIHRAIGNNLAAINYATLGMQYRDDWYLYDTRAWTYIENDNPELALIDFNRAIELNPEDGNLWSGKAKCFYEMERFEDALTAINQAIEMNKLDKYDTFLKASILDELEQFSAAESYFRQVIDDFETDRATYNNLGYNYIKQGKFKQAIEIYKKALGEDFDSIFIRNNYATALFELQQYELAKQEVQASMDFVENKDYSYEWTFLARIAIKSGLYEDAFQYLKKVSQSDPEFLDSYFSYKYKSSEHSNYYLQTLNDLVDITQNTKHDIVHIKAKLMQEKL